VDELELEEVVVVVVVVGGDVDVLEVLLEELVLVRDEVVVEDELVGGYVEPVALNDPTYAL
jgi:hypothetical protein